eukprot:9471548-Pyramimonas_sp.AAC.1
MSGHHLGPIVTPEEPIGSEKARMQTHYLSSDLVPCWPPGGGPRRSRRALGTVLGPSGSLLDACGRLEEARMGSLRLSWRHLWPSGRSCSLLDGCGRLEEARLDSLRPSWRHLGPSWTVSLPRLPSPRSGEEVGRPSPRRGKKAAVAERRHNAPDH